MRKRRLIASCTACSLTAALFILCYSLSPAAVRSPVASNIGSYIHSVHAILGLLAALSAVVVLGFSFTDIHALHGSDTIWFDVGAGALLFTLYSMLIVVTAGAVAGAWLSGYPIISIMGCSIAPGVASSPELGDILRRAHVALGHILFWVVCGQLLGITVLHRVKMSKSA